MPFGAAAAGLGAVGSIGSAFIGSAAANKASQQQYQASQNALGLQQQMFQQGQQNLQPYMNLGAGASGQLANLYGIPGVNGSTGQQPDFSSFTNSPDFLFAQSQGNKGVQQYLASTGQTQGSAGQQAISSFNQGLASQQYGNYFNRLTSLAGMGQGAATSSAGMAAQFGQTGGNTMMAGGANLASGTIGSANAWSQGISGATSPFMLAAMMNSFNNRNQSAYGQPSPQLGPAGPGSGDSFGQ